MISSPMVDNGPADVFRQPRKGGPSFEAESRANLPNPSWHTIRAGDGRYPDHLRAYDLGRSGMRHGEPL